MFPHYLFYSAISLIQILLNWTISFYFYLKQVHTSILFLDSALIKTL